MKEDTRIKLNVSHFPFFSFFSIKLRLLFEMPYMSYRIIYLLPLLFIFACQPSFDEAVISLEKYQIEDGFELKVIASEPFLEAPVVIDFDSKGRIWTVEMRGFMRDVEGSSEDQPSGVISILEDQDKDGMMDHSKIFMDRLVMPRALALVYGGLLYVESPNLWFVEIENDKPHQNG